MSTLTADPKFTRGAVLGILTTAYDNQTVGDGRKVVGMRSSFLDENPVTKKKLSNRTVDCIAVKNSSGGALTPGTVVKFSSSTTVDTSAGEPALWSVTGAAASTDLMIGVVDEYLPAAGVPNGEVFWVVVWGPAAVKKTTGTGNGVTIGAQVGVSATAGSAATYSSGVSVGHAINTASTTDTTVRVQVRTANAG